MKRFVSPRAAIMAMLDAVDVNDKTVLYDLDLIEYLAQIYHIDVHQRIAELRSKCRKHYH